MHKSIRELAERLDIAPERLQRQAPFPLFRQGRPTGTSERYLPDPANPLGITQRRIHELKRDGLLTYRLATLPAISVGRGQPSLTVLQAIARMPSGLVTLFGTLKGSRWDIEALEFDRNATEEQLLEQERQRLEGIQELRGEAAVS